MRFLILCLLLLSLAIAPHAAFAGSANTIDEAAAAYNSDKCKECHDDIHKAWSSSWHSKSIVDPRTLKTFRTFILSGADKLPGVKRSILRDMCLICHAPAAAAASDELAEKISGLVVTAADDKDASKREAATKELSKLNINCLSCHGAKSVGPGSQIEPNKIYGPGKGEPPHKDAIGYDTVKLPSMKTSEFCAPCHHGCPPGMSSKECPTQWTVYQEHYLAHGGKQTCQECHMAGEGGASHSFPGIYEKDFAKTAVELSLDAQPTRHFYQLTNKVVPAVVMNVQIKNIGAHDIPHG